MMNLSPYMVLIKLAGAALLVAGIFGGGMWFEAQIKDKVISGMARDAALALAQADQDAVIRIQKAAAVNAAIWQKSARAHQLIADFTLKLTMGVSSYVSPETDIRFPLPCGLMRVYDASLAGADPATLSLPAGLGDGDPCPVKASVAASVLAFNNGKLNDALSDLESWDAWYAAQSALWNGGSAAQSNTMEK